MTESLICGEQHPEHDLVCTRLPDHGDGVHRGREMDKDGKPVRVVRWKACEVKR